MTNKRSKSFDFSQYIDTAEMAILTRRVAGKAKFGSFADWSDFFDKDAFSSSSIQQGLFAVGMFIVILCTIFVLEYLTSTRCPVNKLQLKQGPTDLLNLFSYMNGLFVQRKR